ncbi:hypothetical protein TRFO_02159 [Tritrichomonas foetus]|uniref:Uncharacterized protein n=1 Tax=Tritrichomonas foetus TaxID=1144522 RepID=A0A1J4JD59_9EUKA|nr:hypothetical protein TRFO_02159 [Tritrichomonas foetus]|eukprot:OHS95212.1 hypothetical protein TRFO_02159 [Tritrichomonas foetus]
MVKPGRPTKHIKAHYISWKEDETITFFKLDPKGNIIKENGKFIPECIKKIHAIESNAVTRLENNDSVDLIQSQVSSPISNDFKSFSLSEPITSFDSINSFQHSTDLPFSDDITPTGQISSLEPLDLYSHTFADSLNSDKISFEGISFFTTDIDSSSFFPNFISEIGLADVMIDIAN